MGPLLVLVETEALKLLHEELSAGAPGDVAVKNVLAKLEGRLANPVVRGVVTFVLNAAVHAVELAAAAAPTA